MKVFSIITGILILLSIIIYLYFYFKFKKGIDFAVKQFESGNCIVFGKKGKGKDLLYNAVMEQRKVNFYSNILYNRKYCIVKGIKEFSVEPNTYENLIENNITCVNKTLMENTDYYISDGGIYLASQYSSQLCKKYPSLPVFYALSRQLYQMNIHINTQYLGRVWDKLREQADSYFKLCGSKKIGNYIVSEYIYYDTYKSAMSELQPFEIGFFASSEERARLKEFEAKNGIIKRYQIIQKIKNIHYDTREFHKKIFGVRAPGSVK